MVGAVTVSIQFPLKIVKTLTFQLSKVKLPRIPFLPFHVLLMISFQTEPRTMIFVKNNDMGRGGGRGLDELLFPYILVTNLAMATVNYVGRAKYTRVHEISRRGDARRAPKFSCTWTIHNRKFPGRHICSQDPHHLTRS